MEITIRKREFKNWIYDNDLTQPRVARRLHIPLQEMKDKLTNHEPFTEEQIRDLVYLMGADEAFKVMFFPTLKDRQRIKQAVVLLIRSFHHINRKPQERELLRIGFSFNGFVIAVYDDFYITFAIGFFCLYFLI